MDQPQEVDGNIRAGNDGRFTNDMAVVQVLGALMQRPELVASSHYKLAAEDFPQKPQQIIYNAIKTLADEGCAKIDEFDIDHFIQPSTQNYQIFTESNGDEYCRRLRKPGYIDVSKLDYYYSELKKISLLNKLKDNGVDVSDVYNPSEVDPAKNDRQMADYRRMSVGDILSHYGKKINDLQVVFGESEDLTEFRGGEGLLEEIEGYKDKPDVGSSFTDDLMTTVYSGKRFGTVYLESAPQGEGKTRRMAGEAMHDCIPEVYDRRQKKWVKTGNAGSVLFIETELSLKEVRRMWVAYVAGVDTQTIRHYSYKDEDEHQRVVKAAHLIEEAKDRLRFVSASDFDADDIVNIITQHNILWKSQYVYFDYLANTEKVMSQSAARAKISGLRSDQTLWMFINKLKNTAQKLKIFIWSSTQLSGDWKQAQDPDQQLLRDAKSLSDKVDEGAILLPVRDKDRQAVEAWHSKPENKFLDLPTHAIWVYKVRDGDFTEIHVFGYFDRGSCHWHDCFALDHDGKDITDKIKSQKIEAVIAEAAGNIPVVDDITAPDDFGGLSF
jgi:replicative DNA helicase